MGSKVIWLLVLALCFLGCTSAYAQTYDKEPGRLRNQEPQRQEAQSESAGRDARSLKAARDSRRQRE